MQSGKTHYCEIVAGPATARSFYRGQASSYRVAAERAMAQLISEGNGPHRFENVSIKTGRVG